MQQPSNSPHERIGRYEVLRKIATGGMAELFLAKQVGMEGFEKVVAIKRILAHLAFDQEFINMFRDEARIVAKLSHPNIVQIYDLGKADDTYFIAMEYIPGRNLSSVAKKAKAKGQKLPPEYIARCIAQACEGLHYAHTRQDSDGRPLKIVHRDVSPQNIILAFSGGVKLVDFGIAKAATKIAHTRAGVLKGKYAYMSPEQIRGEEIDARSDLFAAGIVLYELLCGRRPFEKDNSIQTLKSIVQEPHVDCRELNRDIPDVLAAIIDKALSKSVAARWQSAQELQVALEDYASDSGKRSNNIAVSKWVTDLFAEEISQDRGGAIVFKGVGEVILPAAEEKPEPEKPAAQESTGVPLARGRGGGSIEERPPIQAPSLSMSEESVSVPRASTGISNGGRARQGLIEEGVIERDHREDLPPKEDAFSDDKTALAGPALAKRGDHADSDDEDGRVDENLAPTPFDDSKTEHVGSSLLRDHELDAKETEQARAASRESHESGVSLSALELEVAGTASLPEVRHAPEADLARDDVVEDNPWDEATIGVPSSAGTDYPELDGFEERTSSALAISNAESPESEVANPEIVDPPKADANDPMWEDMAAFEPAASDDLVADNEGLWDDKTTTNDAYASEQAAAEPVVSEVAAAGANGALTLDVNREDLPVSSDSEDIAGRTVSSAQIVQDAPAREAVLAEVTDAPLDVELELPVPRSDKNVDMDSRTLAGVTSDYVNLGLKVPEGGAYDARAQAEPTVEAVEEEVPARPKPKRGGQGLGQIKLNRKAPEKADRPAKASVEPDPPVEIADSGEPAPEQTLLGPAQDAHTFDDDYEPTQNNVAAGLPSPPPPPPLVAPRVPPPLNPPRDSAGVMAIGSTNVPPAALSLSDMLAVPPTASRSAMVRSRPGQSVSGASISSPSGVEPLSRGVSIRKIREVREPRGVPDPSAAPAPETSAKFAVAERGVVKAVAEEEIESTGKNARKVLQVVFMLAGLFALAAGIAYFAPRFFATDVQLTVKTTPDGADIYLNGQLQGAKTPATIGGLQPGTTYQLRVTKAGFEGVASTVPIEQNQHTLTVNFQLKASPATP